MTFGVRLFGVTGFAWPLLLLGCGSDVDEAGAAALWEKIHAENYRDWARAPGWETARPTLRAHGETADIFVNESIVQALPGPPLEAWPTGSLIVKLSYTGDTPALVAAVEKRDGPWFWAEWDADGDVKYAGRPDVCLNCHAAGEDFVLALALPRAAE